MYKTYILFGKFWCCPPSQIKRKFSRIEKLDSGNYHKCFGLSLMIHTYEYNMINIIITDNNNNKTCCNNQLGQILLNDQLDEVANEFSNVSTMAYMKL